MAAHEDNGFNLYSYFRSSCSARVRIALHFKKLKFDIIPVNLLKGEQKSADFTEVNPSRFVPLLCQMGDGHVKIGQSLSILEYLEEQYRESPKLLPPLHLPLERARVRTLVNIIACDTQPVTNLRILNRVRALGGDASKWAKELIEESFSAFELIVTESAGRFCVGDSMTLADVCLAPAVWGAQRFGLDVTDYPTIWRIHQSLELEPAVIASNWEHQPDFRQ